MDAVRCGEQPEGVNEDAATPVPDQPVAWVQQLQRHLEVDN